MHFGAVSTLSLWVRSLPLLSAPPEVRPAARQTGAFASGPGGLGSGSGLGRGGGRRAVQEFRISDWDGLPSVPGMCPYNAGLLHFTCWVPVYNRLQRCDPAYNLRGITAARSGAGTHRGEGCMPHLARHPSAGRRLPGKPAFARRRQPGGWGWVRVGAGLCGISRDGGGCR